MYSSLFGGLGVNTLNTLSPAAMSAIGQAFASALQNQQAALARQQQERQYQQQRKDQKKAEKKAKKRQATSMGIGIGAGVLGGAALGALAAPAAVPAATAPAAAASAGPGIIDTSIAATSAVAGSPAASTAVGSGVGGATSGLAQGMTGGQQIAQMASNPATQSAIMSPNSAMSSGTLNSIADKMLAPAPANSLRSTSMVSPLAQSTANAPIPQAAQNVLTPQIANYGASAMPQIAQYGTGQRAAIGALAGGLGFFNPAIGAAMFNLPGMNPMATAQLGLLTARQATELAQARREQFEGDTAGQEARYAGQYYGNRAENMGNLAGYNLQRIFTEQGRTDLMNERAQDQAYITGNRPTNLTLNNDLLQSRIDLNNLRGNDISTMQPGNLNIQDAKLRNINAQADYNRYRADNPLNPLSSRGSSTFERLNEKKASGQPMSPEEIGYLSKLASPNAGGRMTLSNAVSTIAKAREGAKEGGVFSPEEALAFENEARVARGLPPINDPYEAGANSVFYSDVKQRLLDASSPEDVEKHLSYYENEKDRTAAGEPYVTAKEAAYLRKKFREAMSRNP